ncbi:MAG: hypothetical protein AVDCRST_MAG95-2087 [uncultured Adhaeribacter sp.]|uniref:Uncharacterized protein n=1 Tax=uncultured Adhaeribacter sp. TaxID=448109 RepID=A0A6J4IL08_9BACT|nr:MAG: hypothetical protein AVDCRST_MAG95-2087 [uncultured Adhaeribacter sp.]
MGGLLDFIFAEVDQIKEDRALIIAHLAYLDEIIAQRLSPEKDLKYRNLRKMLEMRLRELNGESP